MHAAVSIPHLPMFLLAYSSCLLSPNSVDFVASASQCLAPLLSLHVACDINPGGRIEAAFEHQFVYIVHPVIVPRCCTDINGRLGVPPQGVSPTGGVNDVRGVCFSARRHETCMSCLAVV